MHRQDAITAARSSTWMSRQSTDFQDILLGKAQLLSLPKGAYLFHMGDDAEDLFFLVEGIVLTSAAHPVVGQVQGQVIHAGQWFGEAASLGQRKRLAGTLVRRPSQILAVPFSAAQEALATNPASAAALLDLMAGVAEEHMLHAIDLLIQSPRLRLCSRLLTFAGRRLNTAPPGSISIPLSQDELALTSALSRQTVNGILRDLVALGIVELHYGEIRILDTHALAQIVK